MIYTIISYELHKPLVFVDGISQGLHYSRCPGSGYLTKRPYRGQNRGEDIRQVGKCQV